MITWLRKKLEEWKKLNMEIRRKEEEAAKRLETCTPEQLEAATVCLMSMRGNKK